MCIEDEATLEDKECDTKHTTPIFDEPWFWMLMTLVCWVVLMAVLWLLKVCPYPELRHHYLNTLLGPVCRRLGCHVHWGHPATPGQGQGQGQGQGRGLGAGQLRGDHVLDVATVSVFVTAAAVTASSSHVVDLPPSYDMVACYVNPASCDLPSYDDYVTAMMSQRTPPVARGATSAVAGGPLSSDVTQPS